MVDIADLGVVYANPYPQIRALNAWHPSLVDLGGGQWLCSFDLAPVVEAHDYATFVARSDDDGSTWTAPQRILPPSDPSRSHSLRVSLVGGRLVAVGCEHRVRRPDQGVVNPDTFGYAPMDLVATSSGDGGRTWDDASTIRRPLDDTEFETCHPIVELADHSWLLPTSTWMQWDGTSGPGMRAIAMVSRDQGASWGSVTEVFDYFDQRLASFEQSVVQLHDGRLLAVCWLLNVDTGDTALTPYAIAPVGGSFVDYGPCGLQAQTAKLVVLSTGHVLAVYRATDRRGLWGAIVAIEGTSWVPAETFPIWTGAGTSRTGDRRDDLSNLAFGYPQMSLRSDGDVELVFWCREGCINVIRHMRLTIT